MANASDYGVVTSAGFTLPNNDDGANKDLPFELPNATIIVRSQLCWTVRAVAGQPTYSITLNGTKVFEDRIAHPERRVMHVITSALRKGANTLVVERTSSSGSINMDDIILHHQKDI